jgi:hypothetical protein
LWITTNRGVVRVLRDDVRKLAAGTVSILPTRVFGLADGFRASESNAGEPSVFVDALGAIWFATTEGLTRLDPAKVTRSTEPPIPHVEAVFLDREAQDAERPLTFVSGRHDLGLGFTGFDYAAPDAITFAHRLEGLDHEWIDDGMRRDVNYTDLRPGHYRFNVRACSIERACRELAQPLDIVVEPRWFERRAMWAATAAALAIAGWLAARARIRTLDNRARELEARVTERTTELRAAMSAVEAKDRLLHADIEEAARFQAIALRLHLDTGSLGVGLKSMPAALVGGDLVDAFELSDGHYRFLMADTTGHGVQAALMLGVFVTPVFYPASEYPRAALLLLYPNPMAQIIGIWQGLLLNQHVPHLNSILWAVVSASAALVVGASVFAHHRKRLSDLV